jgi:hypothetical protein
MAKALNIAPSQVTRYKKLGAPIDQGIDAVRAWREQNLASNSKQDPVFDEDVPDPIPVHGDWAYDVLARLRTNEQVISGEIRALTIAIERTRKSRELAIDENESKLIEKKIFNYNKMLKVLRKEHRESTKNLFTAEREVVALEEQRGNLVTLDAAKELITRMQFPIITFLRNLPDNAEDETQAVKLKELGKRGLAILRGEV